MCSTSELLTRLPLSVVNVDFTVFYVFTGASIAKCLRIGCAQNVADAVCKHANTGSSTPECVLNVRGFAVQDSECHHIIVEDWQKMQDPHGTLFVSIPSLLDPSVCPKGTHGVHIFTPDWADNWKGLSTQEYEQKKEKVADQLVQRLEAFFPGLKQATLFREVGSPRTHRKFLNRADGSYGPIPSRRPLGMLGMPFNRTSVKGLYCVGDSTFPGQGVNAVVFSGFGCAHRVLCDIGKQPSLPLLDPAYNSVLNAVRNRA